MFSSVGWGEILVLLIVGIIVVGPERLPRIINDVRAMIHAARNAISSAKNELGEDFSEDFEDFRKPLEQLNDVRRLGARGLVSKALLDDDPEFLRGLEDSARAVTGAVSSRRATTSEQAKTTGKVENSEGRGSAGVHSPGVSVEGAGGDAGQTVGIAGAGHSVAGDGAGQSPAAAGSEAAGGEPRQQQASSWSQLDDGDVL